MMRRDNCWLFALLALVLTLGLTACGDDEAGSGEGGDADQGAPDLDRDTGRDVDEEPDVAGEPDVTPDPDVEDEPDGPPPVEICDDEVDNDGDELVDCDDSDDCVCEICNDLLDNDTDGAIDCADPDCSDEETCPERCQNEVDDDADDDVDCDDSECASTSRCTDEAMPAATYEFGDMGYFSRLQFPPDGVPCCFDFDDDPALDNQLLSILELIPDYDPQLNMTGVVNTGEVAVLIEWRSFPEEFASGGLVDFNIFRGVPVSPEPIGPEENAWEDGNGVFQITEDSFDARGPRVRFEDNVLGTDGVLTGGPHFLDLTIPIPELDLDLTLTVFQARVEMQLVEVAGDSPHLETVPRIVTGTEGTVEVGGGKLGGYVQADDLLAFFNDGAALCGCAEPTASPGPLFTYGERPAPVSAYVTSCNWEPLRSGDVGFICGPDDSALCPFLGQLCDLIGFLPLALDVDANKNEINESVSVGLFFDVTGASLDDPPLAE